jgi:hypothetical protein
MKTLITIFSLTILFSSCGEVLGKENQSGQTDFLFSIIGMIMAVAVTNLVKGFNVLIKYSPANPKIAFLKTSRWQLRILWGISPNYWTFLKRGGKSPIFVFSDDIRIYALPALAQI